MQGEQTLAVTLPEQDFYKVLGVRPVDNKDLIRRVYRDLAKKYHPDLNKELKADSTEIMQKLTRAHEVLSNPELRKEYDSLSLFQWRIPKGLQMSSVNANPDLVFKKKDPKKKKSTQPTLWDNLMRIFLGKEKEVERDPKGSTMHLSMGLTFAQSPGNSMIEQAEEEFAQAVKLDSSNLDALYNHGIALYRLGRWSQALSRFSEVARLNPKDQDSRRFASILKDI
jgi:curved DNA-binding protein CbpA